MRDNTPSWVELTTMMNAVAKPASPSPAASDDKTLAKIGIGVATALLAAIGVWIGTGQIDLTKSMSALGPKIDLVSKQLDQLAGKQEATNQQVNAQAMVISQQGMRLSTVEQNQARLMDRMRIVEGSPRLASPAPGSASAP